MDEFVLKKCIAVVLLVMPIEHIQMVICMLKNGFNLICVNKPSYWYVAKNSEQLLHRSNFKKSKLLTNENKHLTEEEIMFENGYSKIFNCGTLTFVYE